MESDWFESAGNQETFYSIPGKLDDKVMSISMEVPDIFSRQSGKSRHVCPVSILPDIVMMSCHHD
jgi:hypothetical protein